MSFRKRNTQVSKSVSTDSNPAPPRPRGCRPSHIDGRLTTSTGTHSFDQVLAGHGGLVLGNIVLIGENGTTDYGGALLKYFASEGVIQGHTVHLVGFGDQWVADLPGLVGDVGNASEVSTDSKDNSRMKIAWRYERLGAFGSEGSGRSPAPHRDPVQALPQLASQAQPAFCHNFDLTKKLTIPSASSFNYVRLNPVDADIESFFPRILQGLSSRLKEAATESIHRVIIPALLSPTLYPQATCQPHHLLPFFQGLRSLLRLYPNRVTTMISLPLDLFPRSSGLVRWMELLSDGVFELASFPHSAGISSGNRTSGAATSQEEPPQGMFKIHKLPIFHERGCGGSGPGVSGDDLAFTVSRKKFVIKPFRLPPLDDDGGQSESRGAELPKQTTVDVDF